MGKSQAKIRSSGASPGEFIAPAIHSAPAKTTAPAATPAMPTSCSIATANFSPFACPATKRINAPPEASAIEVPAQFTSTIASA